MSDGLRLDGLTVGYQTALTDAISINIAPREVVAILGASGSGKSTLLATIAGIVPALGGRVLVDGRDVTDAPIQHRGIGIVFQEPLLFTHLDCAGNIGYGLRRHGLTRAAAAERASELLRWVGLDGYESRDVRALSGGQAQRVALARALAPNPRVMLLDEPFSALDVDLRARLVREVRQLVHEQQAATLYVTHDPAEAEAMADRVIRLSPRT